MGSISLQPLTIHRLSSKMYIEKGYCDKWLALYSALISN